MWSEGNGSHFHTSGYGFVREFVSPWVLSASWPAGSAVPDSLIGGAAVIDRTPPASRAGAGAERAPASQPAGQRAAAE